MSIGGKSIVMGRGEKEKEREREREGARVGKTRGERGKERALQDGA